jgi:predicted MFS family arabinose efflux permease
MASERSSIAGINRDLFLFFSASISVSLSMGLNTGVFNNFAVEVIGIRPEQLGVLESIREVPGLLSGFLISALMGIREPIVGSISLALLALGMGLYSIVGNIPLLILFAFTWSLGLHLWMPLSSSMAIYLSDENERGRMLGLLGSAGSIASITAIGFVFLFAKGLGYRSIYLISGSLAAIGALSALSISKKVGVTEKPKLVIKKRYWLYYLLTLLEGCRKQMFITFAVFVLVKVYGFGVRNISLLMLLNGFLNFVLAPRVGRLIDRVGERKVLLASYSSLILVFLGYALIHNPFVLSFLYILDNLLFLGSISLTTYIGKIAPLEEIRPTLSMGTTMNHVAAVTIPVTGGYIWKALGYEIIFGIGSAIVLLSTIAAIKLDPRRAPTS